MYTTDDSGRITERCWDKDQWYTGAFSGQGVHVTATSWVEDGVNHLRVYAADSNSNVSEYCWDGDGGDNWYIGAFRAQGNSVSATARVESNGLHIRVYVVDPGGTTVEQCWDEGGSGWYVGGYSQWPQPPGRTGEWHSPARATYGPIDERITGSSSPGGRPHAVSERYGFFDRVRAGLRDQPRFRREGGCAGPLSW